MARRPRRSTHRTLAIVTAALVAIWAGYRVTAIRFADTPMVAERSCQNDRRTIADLAPFSPRAAEVRCEPWDIGTGVTGYVWPAPNPRALLLLQHGYGDFAQRYARQNSDLISRLLADGITVYAFDFWGHGRSQGPRGAVDVSDAVDDHLAARRKLAGQSLPVHLLGHGLGGLVTLTSVLRDPTDLDGIILVAPELEYDISETLRVIARAGAYLIPTLPGPMPAPDVETMTADPAARQRLVSERLMYLGRPSWVTVGTAARIAHDNWPEYGRVGLPVLVLHGSADVESDPETSRKLIATIASQDKTLHVVPNGRHALFDDTAGTQAAERVSSWLQERIRRSR